MVKSFTTFSWCKMEPKSYLYLLSCVRVEMDEEDIEERFEAIQDFFFLLFKESSLLNENSANWSIKFE